MNVNRIYPKLWQGSRELLSTDLELRNVDVLVLCAREIQPSDRYFPRHLTILRCPLEDDPGPITSKERRLIRATARIVATHVVNGRRCLVTCQAGLNRSGIVTAMALHFITGCDGSVCVRTVQRRRPGALFNEDFVRELRTLKGTRLCASA